MSETAFPALDSHDGSLRLDELEFKSLTKTISDPVVHVDLPFLGRHASRFGIIDWIDAARKVELTSSLVVSGHCELVSPIISGRRGTNAHRR